MKNTTITIWVNPKDLPYFLGILKRLDELPIEADYKWNILDTEISEAMISNWIWVNLSIDSYLKFMYSYRLNGGKTAWHQA